jgi:hypothetical protein
MRWGEVVERADEILLARQLNEYMGIEDEPTRLSADERARQYGDLEDDEERKLAEQFDRYMGVEHEPRRPRGKSDYSGLHGSKEIILAMEMDEQYGWAGGRR